MAGMLRSVSSPSIGAELPDEVYSLPYFHGDITDMKQVFTAVNPFVDYDGHFLLRKSFSKPGTITVSVLHGKGVKHFSIAKEKGQYYLKDRLFHSIRDLVAYYRTNDVPNIEGIPNVRLEVPIPCPSSRSNEKRTNLVAVQSRKLLPVPDFDGNPRQIRSHSLMRNRIETPDVHPAFRELPTSNQATARGVSLPYGMNKFSVGQRSSDAISTCSDSFQPTSQPSAAQSLYYSAVRDPYQEMAPKLIKVLKETEYGEDSDRCVCGLLFEEAELALGWTMHLSTEPESTGKLFFMGPENETAWNLPIQVSVNLTKEQQDRIQQLLGRDT